MAQRINAHKVLAYLLGDKHRIGVQFVLDFRGGDRVGDYPAATWFGLIAALGARNGEYSQQHGGQHQHQFV